MPNSAGRLAQAVLAVQARSGNAAAGTLIARTALERQPAAAADAETASEEGSTATAAEATLTVSDVGSFRAFSLQFSGAAKLSANKHGDEHSQRLFALFKARTPVDSVEIVFSQGETSTRFKLSSVTFTDFHIAGSFGERSSTESFTLEAKSSERVS